MIAIPSHFKCICIKDENREDFDPLSNSNSKGLAACLRPPNCTLDDNFSILVVL